MDKFDISLRKVYKNIPNMTKREIKRERIQIFNFGDGCRAIQVINLN